ncbi:glutathione S-transferase [Thermomonas sp.]|uniref:glutathione S-transferase family protein n=1 Tax=Thermomonas sp. TaxID=1971895 RepID=UPI00248943B2|nr:glutathione S-transferase [Thermomonas sp.]MDI1253591.1 glutathione S-transferase [Thermomonas sp.]
MTTTLYYAPGAASLLVHWLLIETGEPHQLHLVDTAAKAQKTPEYLALNPNGVVPTLVIDGTPHYEAAAMAMLLAERHPQVNLAPAFDDPRRADYLQWMFNLANMVQPLFRQWWYPHEPAGDANVDAVRTECATRVGVQWQRIENHLAAHGPYMLGEAPTIADFYLTMLMRWSRGMPKPATEWPHLAALAQRMKARPSFTELYRREGLTEWA